MRKTFAIASGVFVVVFAAIAALLVHLGQSAFDSVLAGFFVGVTAAIEVGWFGGLALFSKVGDG